MTVYALAQITITDREAYNRYQARFMDVFRQFKGRLLAAEERPRVLEGAWDREKVILMSFPDEASYHDWAHSPAYQEITKDRHAGSNGVVLLINGFAGQ
ncbi:MAG: DUF1330 domain-containing protein [Hyphomonadaceae bacterium]